MKKVESLKVKGLNVVMALVAMMGAAVADQFETGHEWTVETVTPQKLNAAVNDATAKPGIIGEQTDFTDRLTDIVGDLDELLLRRVDDNSLVRIVVAQVRPPTGAVMSFAGSEVPAGWLLCDGRAVSRETYADLFAVIGVTYGAGDSTTTFNLPDARGRTIAGLDVDSGGFADRLTASGTGNPAVDSRTLGAAGGVDRYTLLSTQTPGLGITALNFQNNAPNTGNQPRLASITLSNGTTYTNASSPSGLGTATAHPITQPTLILNTCIKD